MMRRTRIAALALLSTTILYGSSFAQTSKIELANWDQAQKSITKTTDSTGSFYSLNFRNVALYQITEFRSVEFENEASLIGFFNLCDSLQSLRMRKGESQRFDATGGSFLVVSKEAAITELALYRGDAYCWIGKADLKAFKKKVLPKLNQD